MTMFLLRDDDPNATTDPERLERGYAPLLDAGLKVAFSVIPDVALDTRDDAGRRERFLDPARPTSPDCVRLSPTTPLARWLRAHAGDVDVLAHGLSHRRGRDGTELGALTEAEADALLVQSRDILCTALGRAPSGFVAPWDALSRGSLVAAARRYPLISTGFVDLHRLPRAAWPAHVLERFARREALRVGDAWVLRHRGGRFDAHSMPESIPRILDDLAQDAPVAVIVLHHWMFWDAPAPHPVIVALAAALRGRRVGSVAEVVRHLDGQVPAGVPGLPASLSAVARWARPAR